MLTLCALAASDGLIRASPACLRSTEVTHGSVMATVSCSIRALSDLLKGLDRKKDRESIQEIRIRYVIHTA